MKHNCYAKFLFCADRRVLGLMIGATGKWRDIECHIERERDVERHIERLTKRTT